MIDSPRYFCDSHWYRSTPTAFSYVTQVGTVCEPKAKNDSVLTLDIGKIMPHDIAIHPSGSFILVKKHWVSKASTFVLAKQVLLY